MSGVNIKITIEAEESAWSNLLEAIGQVANKQVSLSDFHGGKVQAAATHFYRKISNSLITAVNQPLDQPIVMMDSKVILTEEDMTQKYHDSFIA